AAAARRPDKAPRTRTGSGSRSRRVPWARAGSLLRAHHATTHQRAIRRAGRRILRRQRTGGDAARGGAGGPSILGGGQRILLEHAVELPNGADAHLGRG